MLRLILNPKYLTHRAKAPKQALPENARAAQYAVLFSKMDYPIAASLVSQHRYLAATRSLEEHNAPTWLVSNLKGRR